MAKANKKSTTSTAAVKRDDLNITQKLAWFSVLAAVFVVPIAMSNWTWMGFKLPLSYDQFDILKVFFQRFFTLIALGAWGWDMFTRGGKIRRTPIDWLILVFLTWVAISTIFSISPSTAFFGKYRRFEGLLSFINYAVLYFLVLQFADRPSRIRQLAETLFWSGFIVAGYGLLQSIGRDPINWHQLPFEQFRPFSTYGNPDLLGGFLMFSLPIALALALAEENLWVRLIYWIGFGINTYVWIVCFTRGAWIGGFVGLVLLIIIAVRHKTKMQLVDLAPLGLTVAGGLAAIIKSLSSTNEVMNFGARFASIFKLGEGSGLTRTEIWQAAVSAIISSPQHFIMGFGPDTFRLVFPTYKPRAYTKDAGYLSVADNVHDYPLQLAAGIGVVGVALLYSIFAWAAIRSAKVIWAKSNDMNRLVLGGFWCAAAAYLVQLMFGLSVTGNSFLLWIAIGAVLAPTATVVEFKAPEWGLAAASVLLVLAGLGLSYQFVLMYADYQYLLANVGLQGQAKTQAAILAENINPFNDMYRAEVGMAYRQELVDAANAGMQAQSAGQNPQQYVPIMKEKLEGAVASLKNTIAFVPNEYDNYVFISSVYNIGGNLIDRSYFADALKWSEAGIKVEPFGPAVRLERARALLGLNRREDAIAELREAWSMDHAYADGALLLAEQLRATGRLAEAIDVLKQTQQVNGSDPSIGPLLQQYEASATATGTPKP
jgi:putative inorganic carbon (HCO3(-)) transporter